VQELDGDQAPELGVLGSYDTPEAPLAEEELGAVPVLEGGRKQGLAHEGERAMVGGGGLTLPGS
jgi:hypothetical protein